MSAICVIMRRSETVVAWLVRQLLRRLRPLTLLMLRLSRLRRCRVA